VLAAPVLEPPLLDDVPLLDDEVLVLDVSAFLLSLELLLDDDDSLSLFFDEAPPLLA
jgi:hypothetical protein